MKKLQSFFMSLRNSLAVRPSVTSWSSSEIANWPAKVEFNSLFCEKEISRSLERNPKTNPGKRPGSSAWKRSFLVKQGIWWTHLRDIERKYGQYFHAGKIVQLQSALGQRIEDVVDIQAAGDIALSTVEVCAALQKGIVRIVVSYFALEDKTAVQRQVVDVGPLKDILSLYVLGLTRC